MASLVATNRKLYLGGYDLSGAMNMIHVADQIELKDATAFGDAARRRKSGLYGATLDAAGFLDFADDGLDEQINAILGTQPAVAVGAETGADGEIAYILRARAGAYTLDFPHGEMAAFTLAAESAAGEPLVRATILHPATARTVTGNGTGRQLGAVAATQKLYASLHVIAASAADTLDVIVQSDDNSNFTTPTTRITFAQAAAIGSEWATPVAGAIADDWWRITYTIGGVSPSFTFIVLVGIDA